MAYPVRTVQRPAVLSGRQNGSLPADILLDTPGLAGGPTVWLVRPAARAWRALTAAASAAGHTLKAISSYRPYADQERIFLQRFTTTPVSSTRRTWRGKTYHLRPGMALAAIPGTSNHGLGLAVDTGEESDGDSGVERLDADTLAWLLANEERFGFSHEVQSEPWHLRYFTGDHIPAAVLAYEAALTEPPAPPTPPETDTMDLIYVDGLGYRMVAPWGIYKLTDTEGFAYDTANPGVEAKRMPAALWSKVTAGQKIVNP